MSADTSIDIESITYTVAFSITGFNISVCDDGTGPFISMNSPSHDKGYRYLSLSSGGDTDVAPTWRFWCHATNTHENSTLGADATVDEVMDFLDESLAQETRDRHSAKG